MALTKLAWGEIYPIKVVRQRNQSSLPDDRPISKFILSLIESISHRFIHIRINNWSFRVQLYNLLTHCSQPWLSRRKCLLPIYSCFLFLFFVFWFEEDASVVLIVEAVRQPIALIQSPCFNRLFLSTCSRYPLIYCIYVAGQFYRT